MPLHDFWFLVIAILWAGYFLLEGFDFGVGMLMARISRDDVDRRLVINTIGPVWDGNEVWLIVAAGATFAAYPEWYASLFSGFYLAMLIILVTLILRGVAFEFRGKIDDDRWRARWDLAIFAGSAVPAALWGVIFGNILHGVPLNAGHDFTGNFLTLLNPYALVAGATTLSLFLLHGAVFLALKTSGELRDAALTAVRRVAPFAVAFAVAFGVWTQVAHGKTSSGVVGLLAGLALLGGVATGVRGREGWAFTLNALAIVGLTAMIFLAMYPNVLPSTTDPAGTLTVVNAASSPYTLRVMTWVAVLFTPVVLLYQGWTYWVFRKRLGRADITAAAPH